MSKRIFNHLENGSLQRIGFFGDSLTHLGMYPYYIELWRRLRQPGREFASINGGIAGMSAHGACRQLIDSFLQQSPDGMVIMFGANDIGRIRNFSSPGVTPELLAARATVFRQYELAMTAIVEKALQKQLSPLLVTPFPYDEYGIRNYRSIPNVNRDGIAEIAALTRRVASKFGLDYVELFDFATAVLKKNPALGFGNSEPVHPGDAGQLYIGGLILEAAGAAPESSAFGIDLGENRLEVNRCRITHLERSGGELNFTYCPETFPFPQLPELEELEALYPFNDKLNQERWRIRGLPSGNYRLTASGTPLGTFTASELVAGINAAKLSTPNHTSALEAAAAIRKIQANDCRCQDVAQARCMLDIQFPDTAYIVYNEVENRNPCPMEDTAERLRRYHAVRKIVEEAPDAFYPPYFIGLLDLVRDGLPDQSQSEHENASLREQLGAMRPVTFSINISRI